MNLDKFSFFEHVIQVVFNAYQANKRSKWIADRVYRGRSSSVSSIFEDSTAIYIDQFFKDETIKILVDTRINLKPFNKYFFPDITIIQQNQIIGIIELKLDLGFINKQYFTNQHAHNNMMLESESVSFKVENDIFNIKFSPNCQHLTLVLTAANSHNQIKALNLYDQQNVIILLNNSEPHFHPNDKIPNKTFENEQSFLNHAKSYKPNQTAIKKFYEFLNHISALHSNHHHMQT